MTRNMRSVNSVSRHVSHASINCGVRFIRTVIAPRPMATTLMFIDEAGRCVRNGAESDMSFIRTRDNKFYLQRVMPNGEVVRWLAPGLEVLKTITNFETFSISSIDDYGGIIVPADVIPTSSFEPMCFHDAAYHMRKIQPHKKITRKDRRFWHRRLFADWRESPDKYANEVIGRYGIVGLLCVWLVIRGFHSLKNNKPFWDMNVYGKTDAEMDRTNQLLRLKKFSDRHPEHALTDPIVAMLSPGQTRLSSARSELRETDFTDPHFHSEFWWKVRHAYYYGHWPRGLGQ